jgi:nucleotide-binding universal stress UspA family protein
MFKPLLVPIDGSDLSKKSLKNVLDLAKKDKVDAIVMAPHKRTGIKGMLLGSQTNEVIVHSSLPVIVLG